MTPIANKFVQWEVPALETLRNSRAYKLRESLNNGGKLSREDKNWITRSVKESVYFKRGIALNGYHFDFSDVLKRYFVKQHGFICEYYAIDKTALRTGICVYQGHFLNTAYWEYVPSILFIMAIFRGQGFLFYFLLAAPHPFIAHSIRCGATLMLLPAGGIPARFPACLLLPIAAGTDA